MTREQKLEAATHHAQIEPAQAQDERKLPDYLADAINNLVHDNYERSQAGSRNRQADADLIRAALTTRPAQTEQQPVPDAVWEALQRMIETMHQLGPHSREDAQLVARYRDRYHLLATRPAQTEQQPEQGALVEALRPFAAIADEYDESEDDSHEIWKDAISERSVRFTLGQCRKARATFRAQQLGRGGGCRVSTDQG